MCARIRRGLPMGNTVSAATVPALEQRAFAPAPPPLPPSVGLATISTRAVGVLGVVATPELAPLPEPAFATPGNSPEVQGAEPPLLPDPAPPSALIEFAGAAVRSSVPET